MQKFSCSVCSTEFQISETVLSKYPNWTPKFCSQHSPKKSAKSSVTRHADLDTDEILKRFTGGPVTGLFTDGSSRPNPGPGGWGAVWVENDEIVKELFGFEAQTTNNRMELTALIEGISLLPKDSEITIYSDSDLCVKTINIWMAGWKAKGWKKKSGPIANLDLIQKLDVVMQEHPKIKVTWIQAHNGWRWNEYVDALSTTCFRKT